MKIKNVAVLGTGTMGHGIALLCSKAGLNVKLYGRSDASLNRGFTRIKSNLDSLKSQGKMTDAEADGILSRIKGVKTLEEAAKDVELVSESLAEDLKLKQQVFARLDELCPEDVILSSNTSGLSPTAIAKNTTHPQRVVIAHFWNPPQLLPLVEVVPGEKTSKDTMDKTCEFVDIIGKKSVRMEKECPGFIGNRLQLALLREALYIVEQGWAKPEEVDKAMEYGHGRRVAVTGPLCSADLGGLDIFYNVASYLNKELCDSKEASEILKKKVEEGKLGTKTGEGFYKWPESAAKAKKAERESVLLYFLDRDKNKEK